MEGEAQLEVRPWVKWMQGGTNRNSSINNADYGSSEDVSYRSQSLADVPYAGMIATSGPTSGTTGITTRSRLQVSHIAMIK